MASSTKKRGQTMTLFLLLGAVLVAVVGFMLFLRGGMEGTGVEDAADLGLSTTSFKAHAHQCLKQEVLNAVDKYGVIDGQGPYIGAYVRKNLPKCIEWDFYEEQGFAIIAGKPEVQVEIAPDTLLVDVKYPIEGEDKRGAFSFEELYYYLPRGSTGQLSFDGADRTKEEVSVSSSDGDAELVIPEGTVVKDADGNPVAEVKLHVLERDFNGLANPLIVGMVAYEITPHVTFSNPVTLKMTYREQDIPSGVAESTLRLAQFERNYNMWFSVPTTVDEEKNTLTASFTHFSPVAPVIRCGEDTYSEFPARYSWGAFIMNCNVGGSAGYVAWATDDGKDLFEDQAQDIGELIFIPSERAEEGEEPVWSLEDQATPPTNDQVSLSPCTINDWDRDDRIDTVDQVTTECVHLTYAEGEGAQPVTAVEELDAGECADADLQTILESCQSFVNEESIGRQDAFKQQEERAERDVPTQDGIKDHVSFEEETLSGCLRQITESGQSFFAGGSWSPATPNTYGYRAVEGIDNPWDLPGGFAILEFRFAGNGGACVATGADGKPMIELEVSSPSGDTIDYRINPYTGTTEEPEFLTLAPADSGTAAAVQAWLSERWAGYKGTLDAKDFEVYSQVDGVHFINKVYIRMDNANEDGAVIAQVDRFVIYGTGVTFEISEHYAECTVTVQDRINYLCGCDGNCNTGQGGVEGEDDWTDSELNTLAYWRGEWNPSAGSVVNGQTLLCDLDMADPRITALRETGWTPFGGYCGDDGPVGMERVVTGGECTTTRISACDYATNNAVECVETTPEAAEAGTPEFAARWQVKANGECGEEQVCRIMGGGATCVGETEVPEECSRDCKGGNNFEVLEDGACYECVEQAAGCDDPEAVMAPGEWELRANLNPGSLPICQPYFEICADEVNERGIVGIERECKNECTGEWSPYSSGDIECTDPRYGPYCCENGGSIGVEVPGVCSPDDTYPVAFCTSSIDGCQEALLRYGTMPQNADTDRWEWIHNIGCSAGNGCCRVHVKEAVEPVPESCGDATRCEDLTQEDGESADEWATRCGGCEFGCHAWGRWCIPEDIETDFEQSCSPTSDVREAGVPQDLALGSGNNCWKCLEKVYTFLGVPLPIPSGEYEWHRVDSSLCGCEHPENGESYRIGRAAWFEGPVCKECAGLDEWVSAGGECTEICTIWNIGEGVGVGTTDLAPGGSVCIGQEGGVSYYKTCRVEDGEVRESGRMECGRGCVEGQIINPQSDCACSGSSCPQCPRTTTVNEIGEEAGETHLTEGGVCYTCTASGQWERSFEDCWCPGRGWLQSDTEITPGDALYWESDDQTCWQCVQDENEPARWLEHTGTDGKRECPDSSCSVGQTSVRYNEWVCVEDPEHEGHFDIKKCIGDNRWEGSRSCASGCNSVGETHASVPGSC